MLPNRFILVPFCFLVGCASLVADPAEDFGKQIKPILEKHCYECHGPKKKKGDLDLSTFGKYEDVIEHREVWTEVLERVQASEMPPEGSNELSFDKLQAMMKWLKALPASEQTDCNKLASDRTANFYRGYVMSRRLNRSEYANTLRDLFGVEVPVAELLPADGGGGEGFDTSGNALFTSSIHIEKYMAAAERVLLTVLPDSTRGLSAAQKAAREKILFAKPGLGTKPRVAAQKIVAAFADRAFRRPTTPAEVERMLTMFDRASNRGDGFLPSVRLALQAVLISPHFLFLVEPEPNSAGVHALGAYPLASRLSYFLWSSMPDAPLLQLASSGALTNDMVLREQVRRMIADPKAEALGGRFAMQWLDLDKLGTEVRPDSKKFPEFNDELNKSMQFEVVAYFNHVIRANRSLLELIDSEYTFVDERLARLYGMKAPGKGFQKVTLNDPNRGGVVGMAAVHASTSFPLRTSPVLRGRWLLDALLGDKVPPPPPDVPALEEESAEASHLSLREQLQKHRTNPDCAGCHNKMDPLGFGLENFDVLGRWREKDRDMAIDSKGTLPSGQSFTGPAGLKKVLMLRKDEIMKHLVRKMTGYAFGRELNKFDNCVVDNAMAALVKEGYRSSVLMEEIALSFPFRHRFYAKPEENVASSK